jgi:hypothetical protein
MVMMLIVIDMAVPLTYNLSNTEVEKITKCENLALQIKNVWKFNTVSIYRLVISAEGVVTRSFLKYLDNIGLTKNIVKSGANSTIASVSHSTQISMTIGER